MAVHSDDIRVARHPLPPRLLESDDPGLVAWRALLPEVIDTVLSAWELEAAAPFLPGGSCAWVAPARPRRALSSAAQDTAGSGLVTSPQQRDVHAPGRDAQGPAWVFALKVAWAHEEARYEADGMRLWQGHGAVRVHRAERRGDTSLLLMDRARPGATLAQLEPWPRRDEVVASLLRRLWSAPLEQARSLPSLATMCRAWAQDAAERARRALPHGLVEHGLGLFVELATDGLGIEAPLATDLHHENVLAQDSPSGRTGC